MLIDRGVLAQRKGDCTLTCDLTEIDIPDTLQGVLTARIDRLPEDAKHTLRVAAVIGRQFPVRVLQEVLKRQEASA